MSAPSTDITNRHFFIEIGCSADGATAMSVLPFNSSEVERIARDAKQQLKKSHRATVSYEMEGAQLVCVYSGSEDNGVYFFRRTPRGTVNAVIHVVGSYMTTSKDSPISVFGFMLSNVRLPGVAFRKQGTLTITMQNHIAWRAAYDPALEYVRRYMTIDVLDAFNAGNTPIHICVPDLVMLSVASKQRLAKVEDVIAK